MDLDAQSAFVAFDRLVFRRAFAVSTMLMRTMVLSIMAYSMSRRPLQLEYRPWPDSSEIHGNQAW